jgi:hypothetical protein
MKGDGLLEEPLRETEIALLDDLLIFDAASSL